MMTTICHISNVHPNFDIRIFVKECRTLKLAGYRVILIIQEDSDKTIDGIEILHLPKTGYRAVRMFILPWIAFFRALRVNASSYHIHDPELLPVLFMLKILGKKTIFDVHENVALQILDKHWLHPMLRRSIAGFYRIIEKFTLRSIDAIVTATPSIAENYNPLITVTIQNFPFKEEFTLKGVPPDGRGKSNDFIYMGNITRERGIVEMIDALAIVNRQYPVKLHLAGKFSEPNLFEKLQRDRWEHIIYYEWISREKMSQIARTARGGLLLFHPISNHVTAMPNKLFEYMASSLPIVASNFPLWKGIIESVNCGKTVNPMDPEAIAAVMCWIVENESEASAMGKNGYHAVIAKYNWESEQEKLITLYEKIVR